MPIYTIQAPSGHELDIDAPDEATAITGAQQWYSQNVANKKTSAPDQSMLGALSEGTSELGQGVGKTIKDYFSPEVGKAILANKHVQSDPKYQSATEGFMHPEDGAENHRLGLDWSKLPRAAVEQAPGLALDLGVQALVPKWMGPAGKYISNAVTYGLRTAGSEAEKRAAARTGDQNAEPNAEDKLLGLGSTGAQVALNQYGLNKIISPAKVTGTGLKGAVQAAGNVAKAAGAEGTTSAAQDLVSQGLTKAGTDAAFDPQEALGAGVMGGLGGGVFSSPRGVKDASIAVRNRDQTSDAHTAMAANRMIEHVDGDVTALKDPQTAAKATKYAIDSVSKELSDTAKTVSNPSKDAANAIERVKSGEALSQRELNSIDAEGNDTLSSLARQATALSKLTDQGRFSNDRFAGGASEFVRAHAFGLGKLVGGVGALSHAAGQGAIGLDTLLSSVPSAAEAVAAGAGGYKLLQGFDKLTGAYRPAHGFADKFGDKSVGVRPDVPLNQNPSGPKVVPQNSLTPSQPWGPVAPAPQRFKPDIIDPGMAKIVEKLQNQKRRDTANEAMPLLRQLSAQAQPAPQAPGIDAGALNEQVKSALLMASARRKIDGQRQAEAEAAASPMIGAQGGLDAVSNPAMGKRANELISAANALRKLREVPEADSAAAPAQPQAPPAPSTPEPFVLPESPHVFKEPKDAAEAIYSEALAGGKAIRHAEGFKAGTTRRLAGEEAIYNAISKSLGSVQERGDFHKYLSALWGSDSPEVVTQVRDHMLAEFPHRADTISKHLSDEAIKGLWTKPKKKK